MADITLKDGREIDFDFNAITLGEWRAMFEADHSTEEDDKTLAKAAGITPDELVGLGYEDYRRLAKAFFQKAREPLADPNSVSESISTSSGDTQNQSS